MSSAGRRVGGACEVRLAVLLATVAAAVVPGCFAPAIGDAQYRCGVDGACPAGFTCVCGVCTRGGPAPGGSRCDDADGGTGVDLSQDVGGGGDRAAEPEDDGGREDADLVPPPDVAGDGIGADPNADPIVDLGTPDDPRPGEIVGSRTSERWGLRDLTAEGTLDWIHWGHMDLVDALNRKANVEPLLSGFEQVGGKVLLRGLDCCADPFAWSDGTPVAAAESSIGGVFIDTAAPAGDGFLLTAKAGLELRRLRLYTGNWCVRARLEASLSDGSAPTLVDTSHEITNARAETSVYTVEFRAGSPDATLLVRYVVDENFCRTGDVGELWLMAATLGGAGP